MGEIITTQKGLKISTINFEEVVELHEQLSSHPVLLEETEPVHPPGIKNENSIQSAVARQTTSMGSIYKYSDIYSSCATLLYGVIKAHGFHNGNKRAGFMSMIKHLYCNGKMLKASLDKEIIYDFLRAIASNQLISFAKSQGKHCTSLLQAVQNKYEMWDDDAKIEFIALWIQQNTRSKNNNFRPLKWEDVWKILETFDIKVTIDEQKSIARFTKKYNKRTKYLSWFNIPSIMDETYKFSGEYCDKKNINKIRNLVQLTKAKAVDDEQFYNCVSGFDYELAFYKQLISKLART